MPKRASPWVKPRCRRPRPSPPQRARSPLSGPAPRERRRILIEEPRTGPRASRSARRRWLIFFHFFNCFEVRNRKSVKKNEKKRKTLFSFFSISISLNSPDRLAPYPHEPARLLFGDGPSDSSFISSCCCCFCCRCCRCRLCRSRCRLCRSLPPPAQGRARARAQRRVRRPLPELRRPRRDRVPGGDAGRCRSPRGGEARGRGRERWRR